MATNSNGNTKKKFNVSVKLNKLHNEIFNQNTQITEAELFEAYKKSIMDGEPIQKNNMGEVRSSDQFSILSPLPPPSSPAPATSMNLQNIYLSIALIALSILFAIIVGNPSINFILGIRCFIPNNYLIWEATRPISDCRYCHNVNKPLILPNMTRQEFLVLYFSLFFYYYLFIFLLLLAICLFSTTNNYKKCSSQLVCTYNAQLYIS